ncbi:MAG TPA: chemotaxis protein CheW [Bryobacteraceae bacterium]|nr:chemotaxis protein CheW [Bryobacteraceae bacterium]
MTPEYSPEHIRAVFRQRAVRLAQKLAVNKPASPGIPALVFRLSEERYAVALRDLAEVLPFERCAPVPGSPPHFRGVINLRGELRPVVDLARLVAGTPSADSGALLILRREFALKVDAVEALREIRSEEMTRPAQGQYVQALLAGAVALLDVEAILPAVFSPKESPFV